MKRNVSVACVFSPLCCNILISGKIIKEMPCSVASETLYITVYTVALDFMFFSRLFNDAVPFA